MASVPSSMARDKTLGFSDTPSSAHVVPDPVSKLFSRSWWVENFGKNSVGANYLAGNIVPGKHMLRRPSRNLSITVLMFDSLR